MTPQQLAQRIAALDWSGVSLQHLLAVTAAVETLNALESPAMETNVVPFLPVRPAMQWVRLLHLDGREWASAGFIEPGGAWAWIAESVAAEHGCNEDDVHCLEDPGNGGDLVTVDGLPLYRIAHGLPAN